MKNLKNLNLVELNAEEMRTIEGGGQFLDGWAAAENGKDKDPDWSFTKKAGWTCCCIVKAFSF